MRHLLYLIDGSSWVLEMSDEDFTNTVRELSANSDEISGAMVMFVGTQLAEMHIPRQNILMLASVEELVGEQPAAKTNSEVPDTYIANLVVAENEAYNQKAQIEYEPGTVISDAILATETDSSVTDQP